MAGETNWAPTTQAVVMVGTTSVQLLAANLDARIRIISPLSSVLIWLGLDTPAAVGAGMPITSRQPWHEKSIDKNEPMFRGMVHAVHNIDGASVPVLVIEGVEVMMP